jgi:hypothetical protein
MYKSTEQTTYFEAVFHEVSHKTTFNKHSETILKYYNIKQTQKCKHTT